ncbi:MAG: hypothetical protein R2687_02075 [Candidatus Nanopelagicales bacterium]
MTVEVPALRDLPWIVTTILLADLAALAHTRTRPVPTRDYTRAALPA